jgi:hypothetical protein
MSARVFFFTALAAFAFLVSVVAQTRPRARDLGIVTGIYPTGGLTRSPRQGASGTLR